MSDVCDNIADAVGFRFNTMTGAVVDPATVVGPLGLSIPLRMKLSHGTQQVSYLAICWKVVGKLYIAVCYEPESARTTVLLLDKGRYTAKHPSRTNLADIAKVADAKKLIDTVGDYTKLWSDGLIGTWSRTGLEDWHKVMGEEEIGPDCNMGRVES